MEYYTKKKKEETIYTCNLNSSQGNYAEGKRSISKGYR